MAIFLRIFFKYFPLLPMRWRSCSFTVASVSFGKAVITVAKIKNRRSRYIEETGMAFVCLKVTKKVQALSTSLKATFTNNVIDRHT